MIFAINLVQNNPVSIHHLRFLAREQVKDQTTSDVRETITLRVNPNPYIADRDTLRWLIHDTLPYE